ncbi:MAG: hypothetical protein KDD62_14845, partial [Bdellovibrionales bacterium]|nr:hypothetical protein [Bdellovibrionales bacterium]
GELIVRTSPAGDGVGHGSEIEWKIGGKTFIAHAEAAKEKSSQHLAAARLMEELTQAGALAPYQKSLEVLRQKDLNAQFAKLKNKFEDLRRINEVSELQVRNQPEQAGTDFICELTVVINGNEFTSSSTNADSKLARGLAALKLLKLIEAAELPAPPPDYRYAPRSKKGALEPTEVELLHREIEAAVQKYGKDTFRIDKPKVTQSKLQIGDKLTLRWRMFAWDEWFEVELKGPHKPELKLEAAAKLRENLAVKLATTELPRALKKQADFENELRAAVLALQKKLGKEVIGELVRGPKTTLAKDKFSTSYSISVGSDQTSLTGEGLGSSGRESKKLAAKNLSSKLYQWLEENKVVSPEELEKLFPQILAARSMEA